MTRFEENRLFVLNDPNAPRLCPSLAVEIGLNESILFLQLEFWIAVMGKEQNNRLFVYKSIRDLQLMFPFWSTSTINRAIHSLVKKKKLVLTENHNSRKYDRTRWFAIDLQAASRLQSIAIKSGSKVGSETRPTQNETPSVQSVTAPAQNGTTIQETSIDNIIETNTQSASVEKRKKLATTTSSKRSQLHTVLDPSLLMLCEPLEKVLAKHCCELSREELGAAVDIWRRKRISSGSFSVNWQADCEAFIIDYALKRRPNPFLD